MLSLLADLAEGLLLRRLEWKLGRRLDGRLQGAYRTVWHGTGLDFTDLRAYAFVKAPPGSSRT